MVTDNGRWQTIFMVCGVGIDPEDVTKRLGFRPTAFLKSGEIPVPAVEEGSLRKFDGRLSQDCWKRALSSKQYEHPLADQLVFWMEKLAPAASALRHLRSVGYWTVIDCQGEWRRHRAIPCLQFRLPAEVKDRMEGVPVDLDFAVSLTDM